MKGRGLIVVAGLAISIAGIHIWANREATELVLDNACRPDGLTARVRANYQGSRFWRSQVAAIDTEIGFVNNLEASRQEIEVSFDQMSNQNREFIENLDREVPALRPSPSEEAVQELRQQALELEEQADAIEQAEAMSMLLEWLGSCRTTALRRAGGA